MREMTETEKHAMLTNMTGESDDDVLATYLLLAEQKLCRYMYPHNPDAAEIPKQFEFIKLEAAAYMLNKRGAEGETAHSENGVSRSYENGDLPYSLLVHLPRYASVVE